MKFIFLSLFLLSCASENTKFAIPLNQNVDSVDKNTSNDYNQIFKPSYNDKKESVNLLDDKSFEVQKSEKDSFEVEKAFISKDQKYVYEKSQQADLQKKPIKSSLDNQKSIPLINEKIVEKVKSKSDSKFNEACYVQFGVFSDKNNAERLKNKILLQYPSLSLEIIIKNNQNLLKTKGYNKVEECYSQVARMNKDFPDIFVVNSGN